MDKSSLFMSSKHDSAGWHIGMRMRGRQTASSVRRKDWDSLGKQHLIRIDQVTPDRTNERSKRQTCKWHIERNNILYF